MKQIFLNIILIVSGTVAAANEPISLNAYINEVGAENLTLKANEATIEAANAKSDGFKLPDPIIGYIQMQDKSGSASGFEVSQTIPFPTKLASDHSARKIEAKTEIASAKSSKKDILAKARLLYISVWAAQEKVEFLKEKQRAVREHLKLSTASARSDSSLRIHTLKAESDLDLIESDILEADQLLKEQQIAFAEFANKDPATYRPVVETPQVTEIPKMESLKAPSQLEVKRLNVERLNARAFEAKSTWLPDLNVRYRDVGATGLMPAIKEVMVGATVPFAFFWEPRAATKSAQAEKLRAEAEYSQEKIRVEAATYSLLTRAESLRKQLDLINSKLLPRAEKRMKLVHNLAPRDMESLDDHRQAMEEFPDLKLKALNLRMQFESTVAELLRFVTEEQK